MQIIEKGCGQGKTTELLEIAVKEQCGFVCFHQQELLRIKRMQLDLPMVLTFQEFKRYKHRGYTHFRDLVFDNVDVMLPTAFWVDKWEDRHTAQLIRLSAEKWQYISAFDHDTAIAIVKMADELGLDIPFPIFYDEKTVSKHPVLIHNPFIYLQHFAGRYSIRAISLSSQPIPPNRTS